MTVKVFKSSGYDAIDDAVALAANASTYSPKLQDCKPVEGDVAYVVDIPGDPSCPANAGAAPLDLVPPMHDDSRSSGPLTAFVRVTVAADGKLVKAVIEKSSGSEQFDRSAVVAAAQARYAAAIENCAPVQGTAVVKFEFKP